MYLCVLLEVLDQRGSGAIERLAIVVEILRSRLGYYGIAKDPLRGVSLNQVGSFRDNIVSRNGEIKQAR